MHHQISRLLLAACAYNGADPARNQHLIKVHNYARMIAHGEHIDAHTHSSCWKPLLFCMTSAFMKLSACIIPLPDSSSK